MTKEAQSPDWLVPARAAFYLSFGLRHSFGLGDSDFDIPSCFVIRHSTERLIQHSRLVPAARLPPPAEPPARVPQRLDLALFAPINHAHRDELDFLSGREEFAEQFRFNLEMVGVQADPLPGIQPHESKTALRVG